MHDEFPSIFGKTLRKEPDLNKALFYWIHYKLEKENLLNFAKIIPRYTVLDVASMAILKRTKCCREKITYSFRLIDELFSS